MSENLPDNGGGSNLPPIDSEGAKAVGVIGGSAAAGAFIGSAIAPGIGSVIGAGIGGAVGSACVIIKTINDGQ
ncbi:hypothetical protein [Treponema phagedenis]|uniref:Uncharacterized protein n=1 Tax=Treponema phagedenis TaxID=162 RepID=A0AAE6M7R2_TREPH|nr:hypothetical protein [Treponema phagedenis]EFW37172.1 hypothetical protein HMPREF9554_02334 [Treponema phagedenis F0421]NVP24592.1 hypothetical protein [Treponema phagedenis]QEJ94713.1 hypothetical protein FUT79_05490 [Treponema phagedenis]QEJ97649.1 hypothetical protein FUT82_06345 [Treponema phagedenis]QEK00617.1 hypothetical protein FUT84_05180 [Treponema phagedenis]